jgi:hypothetical protein
MTLRATIVRGHITRMNPEPEWEDYLVETDSIGDPDAVPHYVQGDDGKYHEYYDYVMPEGKKLYLAASEDDLELLEQHPAPWTFGWHGSRCENGGKIYEIRDANDAFVLSSYAASFSFCEGIVKYVNTQHAKGG